MYKKNIYLTVIYYAFVSSPSFVCVCTKKLHNRKKNKRAKLVFT